MIRVRTLDKANSIIELPKNAAFVEVCDNEGNIACVIHYDKTIGNFNIFDYNSDQGKKYELLFKTKFIEKKYKIGDLNIKKEI